MYPHLVIDCTRQDVGVLASLRALLGPTPILGLRAFEDELPPNAEGFASILVGGSQASVNDGLPWQEPLFELLRDAARRNVPVLGICFGHQAIAHALFGPRAVRRAPRSELGWVEVERRVGDPLFVGFPARFPSFVSHFDEVVAGHTELEVLARSDRCPVHAFRVRGRAMVGVQFHPELPTGLCAELVRTNLAEHRYLGSDPAPVLARALDVRAIGRALLANFLGSAWVRRAG